MNYGCIGEHLSHSFSKIIHGKIGEYEYELKEISKENLDSFLTEKDFLGINVTIPYKTDVIPYLDHIDPVALEIGAVNTIVNKNGLLYGYNTDFYGMKALIIKNGIDLKEKKVLILGTGGTSKTATSVAKSLGARKIYTVSRSHKENSITYEMAHNQHRDADIIINTTPLGMYPNTDGIPIDIDLYPNLSGIVDAIYNPLRSELVSRGIEKGINSVGGMYMLVAQAVYASEKFLQKSFSNALIDSIYEQLIFEKENLVLIGMPGCGKTTLGKKLADVLGKKFLDTDALIEEKYQQTPAQIIKALGIDDFRKKESAVIEEIAPLNGVVIATGGGSVLNKQNVKYLKKNGKIFFIDRAIENIVPTSDRPLSSNYGDLKKLYEERYPIYTACMDCHIKNTKNLEDTINKILNTRGDIK